MQLRTWLIMAAGTLLLAACNDAIQFPGTQKRDTSETTDNSPGTEPATETTTTRPDSPTRADTSEPATDAPDQIVPGASEATEADPDPALTDEPTQPEDSVSPAPGTAVPAPTDLGQINASICAASAEETLTIAQLTGADVPAEPVFGTAVVNGAIARRGDFPGIVKMEPKTDLANGGVASGHCGATRIAEHWFITAAHCLDEDYDRVELIAGTDTLSSPMARRVNAQTTICHASYGGSRSQYANDIALVRVGDDMLADLSDVPVARYGASLKPLGPANYQTVDMAGWGLTGFDENLSNSLLTARLTLMGAGPAIINVASLDGAGPCVGDSGGPLFVTEEDGTKTVVGVLSVVEQNTSTGEFCQGQYNGRYTNLQGFSDWISNVISACDQSAELCGN